TVRAALRRVARQAWPGSCSQLPELSTQATKTHTGIGGAPYFGAAILLRADAAPIRIPPVSSLSEDSPEATQDPEPGGSGTAHRGQQRPVRAHAADGSLRHRLWPRRGRLTAG